MIPSIILLAPLAGAIICGFFWRLIGEQAGKIISTGLLFLAAILSWYIFLTFDGVTQHITLLRWLESGEVDAALLYGAERSADIQTNPLVEEPLWVIGPSDVGLTPEHPLPLADLARHRLVLPSAPHGIRTLVEHACAVAHISLNISVETNALSVQRALVLGGHGLTILPPIAVAEDLRTGQLSGAPLADPPISRTIVVALPTQRPISLPVRHTVHLLEEVTHQAIASGTWPEGQWLGP